MKMNWEKSFTKWIGSRASVVAHTIFFLVMFGFAFFGIAVNTVLLVLTTVVSLEAIYLSIFIQMTVNQNTESLEDVEEDIEDIAEEVTEISEDIDEIQHDVDEIQVDVDEIQQDVGEEETASSDDNAKLENIENTLKKLIEEVRNIKKS